MVRPTFAGPREWSIRANTQTSFVFKIPSRRVTKAARMKSWGGSTTEVYSP